MHQKDKKKREEREANLANFRNEILGGLIERKCVVEYHQPSEKKKKKKEARAGVRFEIQIFSRAGDGNEPFWCVQTITLLPLSIQVDFGVDNLT